MNRRFFLGASLVALAGRSGGTAWADPLRRPRPRPVPAPEALLARARLGAGQLGFLAFDLRSGAVRASHQPDLPLPPASTLKIVTALYALDRLGARHRFATRVLRAGDSLVLAGGGDPTLDTDALAGLARETAKAASGWQPARFLVWGGALPRIDEVAPGQAAHLAYNPTLSGMMLNFNRVHLGWHCAESCAFSLEARAARRSPRAYTVQAALRQGGGFGYAVAGVVEHWQIPRAGLGKSGSRWLPVRQPEIYAGDVFQTLCRAEGLALPEPEVTHVAPDGVDLARHDSAPLPEILTGMLEFSTNLTAEAVGLAASGASGLRESAAEMARWIMGITADAGAVPHGGTGGGNAAPSGLGVMPTEGAPQDALAPAGGAQAVAVDGMQAGVADGTRGAAGHGTAARNGSAVPDSGTEAVGVGAPGDDMPVPDRGTLAVRFLDHSGLSGENRITARALAGLLMRDEHRAVLSSMLKTDPLRDVLGKAAQGDGQGGAPRVRAKTGTLNFVSCLAGYAWTPEPDTEGVAFAILAADQGRRAATAGAELPDGVLAWVKRAKEMQRDLIEGALRPTVDLPLPPEI